MDTLPIPVGIIGDRVLLGESNYAMELDKVFYGKIGGNHWVLRAGMIEGCDPSIERIKEVLGKKQYWSGDIYKGTLCIYTAITTDNITSDRKARDAIAGDHHVAEGAYYRNNQPSTMGGNGLTPAVSTSGVTTQGFFSNFFGNLWRNFLIAGGVLAVLGVIGIILFYQMKK